MNIRESLEELEERYMSPYASLSSRTRGRDKPEPLCDMRPEYQRDRDRILHSKASVSYTHLDVYKRQISYSPPWWCLMMVHLTAVSGKMKSSTGWNTH